MCFAPQRRALFRHLNFQKWSGAEVFCAFWLGNVLRATTACNFSTFIWPAGSAPAALASLLFDPREPQFSGKTQRFATFLLFRASPSSFFLLFLFYSSLFWSFSSLCLCPALLCFSFVHIVGSLTSKLPSIIILFSFFMHAADSSSAFVFCAFSACSFCFRLCSKAQHSERTERAAGEWHEDLEAAALHRPQEGTNKENQAFGSYMCIYIYNLHKLIYKSNLHT